MEMACRWVKVPLFFCQKGQNKIYIFFILFNVLHTFLYPTPSTHTHALKLRQMCALIFVSVCCVTVLCLFVRLYNVTFYLFCWKQQHVKNKKMNNNKKQLSWFLYGNNLIKSISVFVFCFLHFLGNILQHLLQIKPSGKG